LRCLATLTQRGEFPERTAARRRDVQRLGPIKGERTMEWIWIQGTVIPIMGMGLGAFTLFGVYRTFNRFLDRRHEREMSKAGGVQGPELEDLRARVEVLEDASERVQELEERLDFTERMLALQKRERLDPGTHR
jgi:hypothetical protein